jgi:hypothetical protein
MWSSNATFSTFEAEMSMTRNLIAIILTMTFLSNVAATGQAPDKLIDDNKIFELFSNPLEDYYRIEKDRPAFKPSANTMASTGNWRGYVATWEIENDVLYLRGIEAVICNFQEFIQRKCKRADLMELFGEKCINGKVTASWYTGDLRIPDGRLLESVNMGYGSIYEREIVITVEAGNIVKRELIDNTKKAQPSNRELQQQELEKLKKLPVGKRKAI